MQSTIDSTASVTDHARQVLKEMSRWGIRPTPENYHVWFNHLSEGNPELSNALTLIIEGQDSFTDEVMSGLYQNYIVPEQENTVLRRAQEQTHEVLKEALDEFLSMGSSASEYETKLATFSERLGNAQDSGELSSIVRGILKDTSVMSGAHTELQDNLKEAITQSRTLQEKLIEAEREILSDHLTGLNNRKAAEDAMSELLRDYVENKEPFSLIVLDIDHFKKFNDTYGHKVGDAVLKKVAVTLQESVKGSDFPARIGGEEFTVLLPGTNLENAMTVANNIRDSLRVKRLKVVGTDLDLGTITASFGAAEFRTDDTVDSLFERADQAMYLAKQSGRDTVKSELEL